MIKELTIATINPRLHGAFTLVNLQQMADTCKEVPVLLGFDHEKMLGIVVAGKVEDGKLVVRASILDKYLWAMKNMYAAPGYTIGKFTLDGKKTVVDHEIISLQSVGITFDPEDTTLPPIKD